MPINEDSSGRNRFDPTKRIRGTLSKEFTESAEAEALRRLALVANSSAIRSDEKPEVETNNNGVKVNRFNVVHTGNYTPFTPAKSIDAVTQRLYSRTGGDKKFHFSINGYKGDDIKLPIINNTVGLIPSVTCDVIVRTALENKNVNTKTILGFGTSSVMMFGIDMFTRFNTVEYNKYFDNLDFSPTDIGIVNRSAVIENLKFSGLKVAKEMVLPNVIRFAMNKFLPEKVTDNTIYKVIVNDINVPRVVTSVTGSIIYNKYANKVINKAYKANSNISDVARACAVRELQSRASTSELNLEAIGNVGNRLVDYISEQITVKKNMKNILDSGKEIVISKPKISERKVVVNKKPTSKTKKNATTSTKKVA